MKPVSFFLLFVVLSFIVLSTTLADLTLHLKPYGGSTGGSLNINPFNEQADKFIVSIENGGAAVPIVAIQATCFLLNPKKDLYIRAASNANTNKAGLARLESNAGTKEVQGGANVEITLYGGLNLPASTTTSLFWLALETKGMLKNELNQLAIDLKLWKETSTKPDYILNEVIEIGCKLEIGDLNGDGIISGVDLIKISQQAAKIKDYIQDSLLMLSLMDTDGDRQILANDVYNVAKKVANPGFEMPGEKLDNPPLMAPLSPLNDFNIILTEIREISDKPLYEFTLRVANFPDTAIAVVIDLTAGGIKEVVPGNLMAKENVTFASAIRRGDNWARIVFVKPDPFRTDGVVAKIITSTSNITLNSVLVNDGILPVKVFTRTNWKPKTALLQNFPNPFNPETWIPFELEKPSRVEIDIFNSQGELVRSLVLGELAPGFYTDKQRAAYWDGTNQAGEKVSSGIYFYTIKNGFFAGVKKMALVK
ncbi:hypothetical protein FJ208_01115 [Candidatus Gribaldobacteria bacterium]|nr:hypothetical protein [Candidatus Gribaldobacteria bacterium]